MIISRGVALYIVGLKKSFTDQFTEVMTSPSWQEKEASSSSLSLPFPFISNETVSKLSELAH